MATYTSKYNLKKPAYTDVVDVADFNGNFDIIDTMATTTTYTATITTTWTGSSAPYTQEITINGILATDNPIISPIYSSNNATAILEKNAWNLIGKGVTADNKITFTCFEEKPITAINIAIKVVR